MNLGKNESVLAQVVEEKLQATFCFDSLDNKERFLYGFNKKINTRINITSLQVGKTITGTFQLVTDISTDL